MSKIEVTLPIEIAKKTLIYGSYSEVVITPRSEQEILKQLSDRYLYKDILMTEREKVLT